MKKERVQNQLKMTILVNLDLLRFLVIKDQYLDQDHVLNRVQDQKVNQIEVHVQDLGVIQ